MESGIGNWVNTYHFDGRERAFPASSIQLEQRSSICSISGAEENRPVTMFLRVSVSFLDVLVQIARLRNKIPIITQNPAYTMVTLPENYQPPLEHPSPQMQAGLRCLDSHLLLCSHCPLSRNYFSPRILKQHAI